MNVGKSLNKADLDHEGVNPLPDQRPLIPVISCSASQMEPGVGTGGQVSDTQVHFWLMQCIPMNIYGPLPPVPGNPSISLTPVPTPPLPAMGARARGHALPFVAAL